MTRCAGSRPAGLVMRSVVVLRASGTRYRGLRCRPALPRRRLSLPLLGRPPPTRESWIRCCGDARRSMKSTSPSHPKAPLPASRLPRMEMVGAVRRPCRGHAPSAPDMYPVLSFSPRPGLPCSCAIQERSITCLPPPLRHLALPAPVTRQPVPPSLRSPVLPR